MTNKQKSKIKRNAEKEFGKDFQAIRWNGNELLAKHRSSKHWQVIINAKTAKDLAAHV